MARPILVMPGLCQPIDAEFGAEVAAHQPVVRVVLGRRDHLLEPAHVELVLRRLVEPVAALDLQILLARAPQRALAGIGDGHRAAVLLWRDRKSGVTGKGWSGPV